MDARPGYDYKVEELGLTWYDEPAIEWSTCEDTPYWNE